MKSNLIIGRVVKQFFVACKPAYILSKFQFIALNLFFPFDIFLTKESQPIRYPPSLLPLI